MPIAGFDYKAFAVDLANQAMEILKQKGTNAVPEGLTDVDKKTIVETVRKFCYMSGEALSNDPQIKFNAEQACLVTQFIGEWTFHKLIDLIKSSIPVKNREPILQAIAANIFNTAKLAIIKKMPQDALISLIEEKVKKIYNDELQKLVKQGILSPQDYEKAVNTSNLNDMVQKNQEEAALNQVQQNNDSSQVNDKKVLKLASLAIILKRLPEDKVAQILSVLDKNDIVHVQNYMKMSNLEDKIDHNVIIKALEEIKKIIPPSDTINVGRILQKHYKYKKLVPIEVLSKAACNERESVRDFILDNSFPAAETFSPYVLQSLVTSIEEKINDN